MKNIWVKRPGTGAILAEHFNSILGKKATRNIENDEQLNWKDFLNKTIVFLSGTRADFGKLKSLIKISSEAKEFNIHIFATGMHLQEEYGYTVNEIVKSGFQNIHPFANHQMNQLWI